MQHFLQIVLLGPCCRSNTIISSVENLLVVSLDIINNLQLLCLNLSYHLFEPKVCTRQNPIPMHSISTFVSNSIFLFLACQGLLEGLKAYRSKNGSILLFRPNENALRMKMGAERLCMPSPTVEQFVDAVNTIVLENKRWVKKPSFFYCAFDNYQTSLIIPTIMSPQVPPPGKGSLYIRPLLIGSGAVLGVAPAPEYTFLIYVSPVGNYFKVDQLSSFILYIQLAYSSIFMSCTFSHVVACLSKKITTLLAQLAAVYDQLILSHLVLCIGTVLNSYIYILLFFFRSVNIYALH